MAVGAALGASLAGLLGVQAGIVWVVAGVWTVRWVWGRSGGIAWGLAVFGVGLRWGTLSLADVHAATRVFGPTIATGSGIAIAGSVMAFVGAFLAESRHDGFRASGLAVRLAAGIALVSLTSAFVVAGPGSPQALLSALWWLGASVGVVSGSMLLARFVWRVPQWFPVSLVAVGVALIGAGIR